MDVRLESLISSWRWPGKDEEGLGRRRTEEGVEGNIWRRERARDFYKIGNKANAKVLAGSKGDVI